jgi:hypothetical protein
MIVIVILQGVCVLDALLYAANAIFQFEPGIPPAQSAAWACFMILILIFTYVMLVPARPKR